MKNRFFNQRLLSESYGFVRMRQALSLKELNDSVEFYSAISFNRPIIGYIRCSKSLNIIHIFVFIYLLFIDVNSNVAKHLSKNSYISNDTKLIKISLK